MCMITEQLEPKIAEKNILVLKHSDCVKMFSFTSMWQQFKYIRFNKYFVDIYKTRMVSEFHIDIGFHSYIHLERPNLGFAYFIIPKGAEYYEGGDNCHPLMNGITARVSNQIIYIGRKNRFNALIAKIFYGV